MNLFFPKLFLVTVIVTISGGNQNNVYLYISYMEKSTPHISDPRNLTVGKKGSYEVDP